MGYFDAVDDAIIIEEWRGSIKTVEEGLSDNVFQRHVLPEGEEESDLDREELQQGMPRRKRFLQCMVEHDQVV